MADLSATSIPLTDKLYKYYTTFTGAYLIGPHQFFYPKNGPEVLKKLQNFSVRDDDVYVVTYPKTGTTWMQEIVYLLKNNIDFEKARRIIRDEVFPYADINVWEDEINDQIEVVNNLPSPRLIKFHLNYSFLPPDVVRKCKVIYVFRNVKDTIVSNYYFHCAMLSTVFNGSIEEFVDLFIENKVPYSPYITHVKEFWEKRHEKNIYVTTYEEMQKDQEKIIKEVAEFLNTPVSSEQIKMIADHCKFDNMKKNPAVNKSHWGDMVHKRDFKFMRKGVVGNWRAELSEEIIDKIDKWIDGETIGNQDLRKIL